MSDGSGFEFYSLGYVAKDKEKDKFYIEVAPIEQLPSADGKIVGTNIVNDNVKDSVGKSISNVVNKSTTLLAKWVKLDGSNRVNPPDVCKGETVFIYTFNSTDAYFWSTMFVEPDLRKRERAMYFWSNKGSVTGADWANKGYSMIVDTYDKYILLHTTDNDGEAAAYDIEIDTGKGTISISDNAENKLVLTTTEHKLQIKTNASIELETKKFSIKNSVGEVMSILSSLVTAIMNEVHVDSQKGDTYMKGSSKTAFSEIKAKLDSFIK